MDKGVFVCPLCGNQDEKYIGYKKGVPYCRKCISFIGQEVVGDLAFPKNSYYKLDYDLTEDQKRLSNELIKNYKEGKDSLVHAVCGAGKTEIVLNVIAYAIKCGEKVGFAIPRRDVVIEIYDRFKNIFKNNTVTYVCGGHTDLSKSDFVVLTTHQLYRYPNFFDLLIVDEIDAFPFNENEVLNAFFLRSVKGHYIMMSATPSTKVLNSFKKENKSILELFSRYHMHPLPVPKIIIKKSILIYIKIYLILSDLLKKTKKVFIFTPTIAICEQLFMFLRIFIKGGMRIHSKVDDRTKIIEDFRKGKYKYLVTTAVLERGVTFKDLQVIIFKADHPIYSKAALVQISGRVGRKIDAPEGEVIFLANETNREMENAIKDIKFANEKLQNML